MIDPDRLEAMVDQEDAAIVESLRRHPRTARRTPPTSPSSMAARQFDLDAELSAELAKQDQAAAVAGGGSAGQGARVAASAAVRIHALANTRASEDRYAC